MDCSARIKLPSNILRSHVHLGDHGDPKIELRNHNHQVLLNHIAGFTLAIFVLTGDQWKLIKLVLHVLQVLYR